MQIKYKKKKMIIEHPSGHVDIYDEAHLQLIKAGQQRDRDTMVQVIADLDNHIAQIRSS